MKKSILYVIIYMIFIFVSCTHVTKNDMEVKIISLTQSERVYFIQKGDTIEFKCYIVTEDSDKVRITIPYSINDVINELKRENRYFSVSPIAQRQMEYRDNLQEITTCLKVVSSKFSKKKQFNLHCDLSDFSDIAITVSQCLPEYKCKNKSQIQEEVNRTTLKSDLNSILKNNNMSVQSITLDSEAKGIYMKKELFLSNHIVSIENIPQKILAIPIKIVVVKR